MSINPAVKHRIETVDAMLALGRETASNVQPGAVWLLCGDLGAGKTHWTKGFVAGLGSSAEVTSPTFALVHEYADGRMPIFHFDFYRLNSVEELYAIGWDEYLEQDGIVIAEWGNRFPEAFPGPVTTVQITAQADGSRVVEIS